MEMILDIEDGMIIQTFKTFTNRVEYDVESARDVAAFLAELANELQGTGHEPGVNMGGALKDDLVERNRMKCTQRAAVMMNSMREDKKLTNGQIGSELVDMIFREVY